MSHDYEQPKKPQTQLSAPKIIETDNNTKDQNLEEASSDDLEDVQF